MTDFLANLFNLFGIDISHWQAKIDFAKLLVAGVRFVIAKAGEIPKSNTEFLDEMYARNIREAKAHDIISGAYYFFHPGKGASRQTRHFISIMEKYGKPDLPVVWDVETADDMQPIGASAVLKSSLDYMVENGYTEFIIYTRWGLWVNQYGNPSWTNGYQYTRSDGTVVDVKIYLWLAQYNNKLTYKPADMSNVIMWQWTDKCRIPGIGLNLDCDLWLKSNTELLKLAGYEPEPLPGPVTPVEPVVSEAYKRALITWHNTHSEDGRTLWDKMNSVWGKLRNL